MDKTYGSAVPQAPSLDEMRLELERREPKIDYLEVAKDLGGQLKDQTVKEVRSLAEPRGVTDVINKGYIASLLGIPADLGNLPFQAIDALTGFTNYPTKLAPEAPVGGSKWWGDKMTQAGMASSTERPVLEIASSFLSPRLATKGAELTGKALEAGAKSLAPKFADLYESGYLTSLPNSSPEMRNFSKPVLDIFAGEKAVGADLDMLAEAKRRVKAKEDPALVWKETGWGKDPTDKKWKFEIDTSGSKYDYAPALAEQQVAHGKLATSVDISYDMANLMERRGMSKQKAIEYVTREYGRPPTAGEIGNAENMSASDLYDMRMDAAKQKPTEDTFKAKDLGDVYQSPALTAYPNLSSMPLQHRPLSEMENTRGSFHPTEGIKLNDKLFDPTNTGRDNPRSVMEHELQHAIQREEGFAPGGSQEGISGNPANYSPKVKRAEERFVNALIAQGGRPEELANRWMNGTITSSGINEINAYANTLTPKETTAYLKARREFLGAKDPQTGIHKKSFQRYQELGGEANARLSQARLKMDAQKRRENYPWNPFNFFKDTKVAVDDVINNPPRKAEGGVIHKAEGGVLHMADAGAVSKIIQAGAGALKAAKQRAVQSDANGTLESIRAAGRAAHEEQASMRAAKDAEVADQMANLPPRNKQANEELGLYHPIGGGIKLSRPPSGMHSTTVADPAFNPPDIGIITPEQLVKEQAALIPLVGDRAAGGRYLTHVGENELETPVRLTAGPRYMDANYNHLDPENSAGWESGAGRVTALSNQAQRAGQDGRPVYGIYTAGSATNTDFNVMGANALMQQIPFSKITKKAEKAFDLAMINGTKDFPPLPEWPGIRNPKALEMLMDKSNGIARTKLFGTMGQKEFQAMGFPDVPATRKAIIEPELLDIPTNQAGFRLARMDTTGRIIEDPIIPSDYPVAMAAKVAGQLDVPADYKDVFSSHFDARRLLSQPVSGDYYSFSRAHPIQYADDDWLNRLMEQRRAAERKIKLGEYAEGGVVQTEDDLDAMHLELENKSTKRSSPNQPSPIEMQVEMMERGHG